MASSKYPVQWSDQTHRNEPVDWIRLIYVNLLRAYRQNPPPRRRDEDFLDTGYQTLSEYDNLRAYLNRWARLQQIDYNQETSEMWIAIPTPSSPNYRMRLTQWNTILRRWPAFIDPEAREKI